MKTTKLICAMMAAIVLAGCQEPLPFVSPQTIDIKVLNHESYQWGDITTKTGWKTIVQDNKGETYKMDGKIGERGDVIRAWKVNQMGNPARIGDKIYLSLENPF